MFFEISKISFLIRASPYASLFSNGSIGACSNEKDKESDYFAMGFRLYDPEIGRFLAIDPLLDVQPSQTPYHYCFNNPTSFTDPTGLYPEKEKGDKVQESMRCDDWELNRALKALLDYQLSYYEDLFFMFKFNAALFSDYCFRKYIHDKIGSSGYAFSVRIGENGNGSFTYCNSSNGVICNVNFRYNKGEQNPVKVISLIVLSFNWQCADEQTCRDLAAYGNSGNSINVDVTMCGEYLAGLFNKHLKEGVKEWEFVAGVSNSNWNGVEDLDPTDGFSNTLESAITELDIGWIYIASNYLDDSFGHDSYYYWDGVSRLQIRGKYMDFNLIFSHEVGHELDKFNYNNCPIWKEFEAQFRVKRQWQANNPGETFSTPYLYHFGGY